VGKKASELVGRTLLEVYPDTEQYWIDKMAEAVLSDRPLHFESFSKVMNTHTEINLYMPQKGQLAMTTANIDERKRAEDALHESERTFRKLFEDSADAILLIDKTGVFVECNQAALNMLKMTRDQFLLSPPEKISPEYQPNGRKSAELVPEMNGIAYEKGLNRFDWTCVDAEGNEFIVEVSLMPIVVRGQTMLHTTWRDITERKRAEEKIQKQLSEKELLLREVHHRVKNTIASIEGLLAFQAGSADDLKVKNVLNDTLSRVQSMRILYEKMLLSGNYRDVPVKAYLGNIVDSLLEVYNYKKNITIIKTISDFGLSSKSAESLGIIASELLTNAFKYGADGSDAVNVTLSVDMEDDTVNMIVQDRGAGIQHSSEKPYVSGFGLTIVRLLVEQMRGTFNYTTQNGTTCSVRYPSGWRK
jgi:PAS domain S-box-containing protein